MLEVNAEEPEGEAKVVVVEPEALEVPDVALVLDETLKAEPGKVMSTRKYTSLKTSRTRG